MTDLNEFAAAEKVSIVDITGNQLVFGQKPSATSLPVVLASNQSAVPVSGTVAVSNFPGTQAVTGTFFQVTQPVSGTLAVTQSTSPWAVSGTVTSNIGTTNGLHLDSTFTSRINTFGQKTAALSTPVVLASDQTPIFTVPVPSGAGGQGNAWNAAVVATNGNSNSIDLQYQTTISIFGSVSANTTIRAFISQDNTNFYMISSFAATNTVTNVNGITLNLGARYLRLQSSAAATITMTVAGK